MIVDLEPTTLETAAALSRKQWLASVTVGVLFLVACAAAFAPQVHPDAAPHAFDPADIAWMLSSSGLVLLMTPGLAFFYGGMVSKKSVISTLLQSFIALGVISVLWYVVGFSLAFGDSFHGIIGNPLTFLLFNHVGTAPHPRIAPHLPLVLFASFQLKFAIITPALISGAFAERIRFWGYLLFMCLFSLLIYCPLAHWTWHPDGFLFKWGVLDFAGGTVVHISAGFAALAGALALGRRHVHKEGHQHVPTNVPFVLLGTGLLWFGWFGFNAGSALAANAVAVQAFFTTHLASAAAMLTWMLIEAVRGQRPSAAGAAIGAVVGLVAITPGAGYVSYGPALFIGVVAAAVSAFAVDLKSRTNLDDTLDVFPCHGVGGIVGMVLTAVFAQEGGWATTGSPVLLYKHLGALVFISAFTFSGSYLLYKLTNLLIPIRVNAEHEAHGLDTSQHGETALVN
ncbi:ammonium transporter [Hymenobacter nivis]|uniref:Ammonium transporter n=1 Tax=Hymenobacter nivis TaxID=1850093 RepID=A0A502GTF0_9BACT|nr:ammonium transporter [Hymenobacter nivis]TPG64530.1 ammonium transporter [Hymenobacter nivis]